MLNEEKLSSSRTRTRAPALYEFIVRGYGSTPSDPIAGLSEQHAAERFLCRLSDVLDDVTMEHIKCVHCGPLQDTPEFLHTAQSRGVSHLHMGMWVTAGKHAGWIVGSNMSANFDVMDEDGRVLNIHPGSLDEEYRHAVVD